MEQISNGRAQVDGCRMQASGRDSTINASLYQLRTMPTKCKCVHGEGSRETAVAGGVCRQILAGLRIGPSHVHEVIPQRRSKAFKAQAFLAPLSQSRLLLLQSPKQTNSDSANALPCHACIDIAFFHAHPRRGWDAFLKPLSTRQLRAAAKASVDTLAAPCPGMEERFFARGHH